MRATSNCGGASNSTSHLTGQYEPWRSGHKVGACFRAALWAGAVAQVNSHGAYRVTVTFRLEYPGLKRRGALVDSADIRPAPKAAPSFAELSV